jgi:hypothetical protein
MPYKSEAQRKYFNVNRKKLEAQGVDVDEWNQASKGKKLPEKKANTPGQTGNIPVVPPTQVRPTAAPSSYVPRPARRQTSLADGQGYKGASVQNTGTPFFYLLAKAAVDNLTGNAAGMPSLIDRGIIPNGQEMVNAGRALAHNTGTGIANYLNRATQLKNYYKGGPEPTVPAPFSTVGLPLFGDADQLPKPNIRHVPRLPKTPDAGPDALLAGFDSLPRQPGSSSEVANPSWLSRLTDFAQSPAGIATGIGLGGLGAGMYLGSRRRKDDDEKEASVIKSLAKSAVVKIALDIISKPRKTKPIHSMMDRLVFDEKELSPPNANDLKVWQNIANYMHAARPHELGTAQIHTGGGNIPEIVNQIARHQYRDTAWEDLTGVRNEVADEYASIPSVSYEHVPASYHPYPHVVIQNERSPGVLIHELGHGIDFGPKPNENKFLRNLSWDFKPELLQETDAWHKGLDAYQKGYAASPEASKSKEHPEYSDVIKSYYNRKYPALGTYFGGSLGGLLGGGLGAYAGHLLADSNASNTGRYALGLPFGGFSLGAALGGAGGVLSGALLGKLWSKWTTESNLKKALNRIETLRNNPKELDMIAKKLVEIRQKTKPKSKAKSNTTAKAAASHR